MRGNQFITISAVVVAAASLSYAGGARRVQSATTSSSLVLVTNSTSQCVPASIYHSITLPVHPSNALSAPLFSRNADGPGHNLWSHLSVIYLNNGGNSGQDSFTVPAGYTLLLRDVGGSSNNVSDAEATVLIVNASHNGTPDVQWCTQFDPVPNELNFATLSREPFLVIPGGDTVAVTATTVTAEANQGSAVVTLSGELFAKY